MRKGFVLNISNSGYESYRNYEEEVCENIKDSMCTDILLSMPLVNGTNEETGEVEYKNPFTEEKIEDIIKKIKSTNVNIMLRLPYNNKVLKVDINNLESKNYFLEQVKKELLRHIPICLKYDINEIIITNEAPDLTNSNWNDSWDMILSEIKQTYKNIKFGSSMTYDELKESELPNILDFVGLNAYPSMSLKGTNQSLYDCMTAWYEDYSTTKRRYLDLIKEKKKRYKKPIFITETGCQPFYGRLISPCMNDLCTLKDKDTQTKYIKATLPVLLNNEDLDGVYIFDIFGGGYATYDYDYKKEGRNRSDNVEATNYIKECYKNGVDNIYKINDNFVRDYHEQYKILQMGHDNKWTKIGEIIIQDFKNKPHCLANFDISGFNIFPDNEKLKFTLQYKYVDNLTDTIAIDIKENNKLNINNLAFICNKTITKLYKVYDKVIETKIDIYFKPNNKWEDYGYKIEDKLSHLVNIETTNNNNKWYSEEEFDKIKNKSYKINIIDKTK